MHFRTEIVCQSVEPITADDTRVYRMMEFTYYGGQLLKRTDDLNDIAFSLVMPESENTSNTYYLYIKDNNAIFTHIRTILE